MDRSILNMPVSQIFRGLVQGKALQPKGSASKAQQRSLTGAKFMLEGQTTKGSSTDYAIAGQDLTIDPDTWVFGHLKLGVKAIAQGVYGPGGEKIARKIVIK